MELEQAHIYNKTLILRGKKMKCVCVYVFTKINFWPKLYEKTVETSKEDILITKEAKYLIYKNTDLYYA